MTQIARQAASLYEWRTARLVASIIAILIVGGLIAFRPTVSAEARKSSLKEELHRCLGVRKLTPFDPIPNIRFIRPSLKELNLCIELAELKIRAGRIELCE